MLQLTNVPFWSHADLLDYDFGVPSMLVDPIIPWGGLAMLHGPYESGKSLMALTLAIAVAKGEMFLAEYPCRQGAVGLVQVDMPDKLYQERQRLTRPVTEDLPVFHVTTDASPEDILRPASAFRADLQKLAEQRPVLVVVDTLRKSHMADENDSNTASLVYGAWRKFFPHTTLLFLHHDRKVPTGFVPARALEEQFRGTTAWIANLDTSMHLMRVKTGTMDDWRTRLTFTKLRTCAEQPAMDLKMNSMLLLEPAELTPRQRLRQFAVANPQITKKEAAAFLQGLAQNGKPVCSRATAYRVAEEFVSGRETAKSCETT